MPELTNFSITHWIETTPEVVWNAYTTPEIFAQFFSPVGLSVPLDSVVLDARPGGRFECTMVVDETGEEYVNAGTYLEVNEPNFFSCSEQGMQLISNQTFTASGTGTLIEVLQTNIPIEFVGPGVEDAFRSTWVKLGNVLGVATEPR